MTNRKMVVTVFLLAFLTFSCSSSVKWYKLGGTSTGFSQDKAACEQALLGSGESGLPKQIYTFEGCMERKGWQQIPASS